MASTINPPSKTVAEWCSVFQAQGTESYTSSVTFMKQLTVVAISTVMYMRNTLPEDNFTVASFGGLKHKILKKKCQDELAQFISTSLAQAFDAFDKKYLHQLVLCFYEDECKEENLFEYYIFEYTYTSDGVSMNIQSRNQKKNIRCTFEAIQSQTTQLMRTCIVMLNSAPQVLPSTVDISLRLYYNDEAPEGYQAPGYAACGAGDHLAATRRAAVALGAVTTPHHKMVARSYVREMFVSGDVEPSETVPAMTQSAEATSFQASMSETSTTAIRCPCNKFEDIGEQLITCSHCSAQQHAACFGYLPQDVADISSHVCTVCSDTKQLPYADKRLAELSDRKRECLCIFRRTLSWITSLASISGAELAARLQMSVINVTKLMRLLHDYGIIEEEDNDLMTPKKINAESLKLAIKRHFPTQDSIADNLVSETFHSQETPDPLGEVLSPMEKVSLQNDSNIGRVIPNPKLKTRAANDEMLKQYQDAISCSADTVLLELPLSGSHNPVQNIDKVAKETEMKCSVKRKLEDVGEGRTLRAGVKNKRVKK